MASTFVVGDLHGWKPTLDRLLAELPFDAGRDRLWMVGDLVNRGPDSLGVLRWAYDMSERMGDRFVAVLGNHDLHLLAFDCGVRQSDAGDLAPVLSAPDRSVLIDWLRRRPLLHREAVAGKARPVALVHAGLWPTWTVDEATKWAREVESALRDNVSAPLLLRAKKAMQSDSKAIRELAFALYGFTSLRTLRRSAPADAPVPCGFKGGLRELPWDCVPWFRAERPAWQGQPVVFGHWAALGVHGEAGVQCLDSGCAWEGRLTAQRLEDGRLFHVERPRSR